MASLRSALAVAWLLVGAASAWGETAVERPPREAPQRIEVVRARLMKAKRAIVSPACGSARAPWSNRGARGEHLVLKAYSRTERDRAWSRAFASALLEPAGWDSSHKAKGRGKPCDQTHQVPLFTVTWQGAGAEVYALLSFEARSAVLFEADRPLGSMRFDDRADTLFSLIRVALAGDSLIQAMSTPPAEAVETEDSFAVYVVVDRLPEVITRVPPVYPEAAVRAELEGRVYVQALIGKDGTVRDAFAPRSTPKMGILADAAVDAVWQWRFSPASSEGRPVAVWVAVPVSFKLR